MLAGDGAQLAKVRRHTNPFDGLKLFFNVQPGEILERSKAHKSVRRIETIISAVKQPVT